MTLGRRSKENSFEIEWAIVDEENRILDTFRSWWTAKEHIQRFRLNKNDDGLRVKHLYELQDDTKGL